MSFYFLFFGRLLFENAIFHEINAAAAAAKICSRRLGYTWQTQLYDNQSFRNPYAFQVSERSMAHSKRSKIKNGLLQTFRNVPPWNIKYQCVGTVRKVVMNHFWFRNVWNKPCFVPKLGRRTDSGSSGSNLFLFVKISPIYEDLTTLLSLSNLL